MREMGSQSLERFLDLSAHDDAFLCSKQIMRFKVVWKGLNELSKKAKKGKAKRAKK